MDFALTPAQQAFREELRAWLVPTLAEHRKRFPPADDEMSLHPDKSFDSALAWHRQMHAAGFVGVDWPREHGGRGAGPVERMILSEELVAACAPQGVNVIGLGMVGPAVMHHGTPEQKARWIAPILSADEIWCQGFSEPGAGSDLANLATRATLDGDHFVVTGQKVWTSNAHRSHYCILLVRTDPAAAKHKGLSCLLVDLRSPGVTIRPLPQITGDAEFSEVFYDQVRVPREHLLGRLHGGWDVAITILMHERHSVGAALVVYHYVDRVLELARRWDGAARDPRLRQRLAAMAITAKALRLTALRYLSSHLRGRTLSAEGSVVKLGLTELYRQVGEIATEIVGPYSQIWGDDPRAPENGRWAFQALFSHRFGIAGGTDQIQRNIIGERLLGLPR